MIRIPRGVFLTALALGTAGCAVEVLSLSEGTSTTLSVRVYVDTDGNGAFGAGDVALSGATVSVTGPGPDLSEPTDADGLASFEVRPGSYTLSVTGAAPAGAVLATAANPLVVAPFQGGTIESQFRYSFFPGSLSLIVFRDEDMNGTYDAGTDTPAGGIGAAVASGTDTVATGNTAADGTLTFAGLRPGDYSLNIIPFPTITVGMPTQTVTVMADAQTDVAVTFTGNLVVNVSDARNVPDGDAVAIEGVVSWQAQFRTTLDAFMQDGTAGITLFDFGQAAVANGDSIRVVGRKGSFRGEVQIDSVFTIDVFGNVGEPTPAVVTAADIATGNFGSQLVTIDGTVDSVSADGFDNATVFLTDAAGGDFSAESDSRTGTASADWVVGLLYSVTGVIGTDSRDTVPFRPSIHHIETRGTGDVVQGGSTITIAAARGMDGQVVTIEGTLTWQAEWQGGRLEGFMQDGTAGIAMFDFGVDPTGLMRGDRIRYRGTIGSFDSEVQISGVEVFAVVGTDPLPTPRAVTAAEINTPMFQGELVTITGTVDSVQVDGFDNARVYMSDGAGDTFVVESDSRSGIASTAWVVATTYTVTGLLGFDDDDTPPARLEVRDANDIQ